MHARSEKQRRTRHNRPPLDEQPRPQFLPLAYQRARGLIRSGDLLLWEPTSFFGRLIARYSDGLFSHVGSASWAGDVLESHEMLGEHGGRTCNLSALVRCYPGKIHVYRIRRLQRHVFSQAQRRRAGEPYGWQDLAGATLRRFTHDRIRMPWRKHLTDIDRVEQPELWERLYRVPLSEPAFCSEAVVSDLRRGGADVFLDSSAWEVTPSMLAQIAEYQFTLYATETQVLGAVAERTSAKESEL